MISEVESERTYFIYFSDAWRRRRGGFAGLRPLRNHERDQKIADQVNTELKTEVDKDLKTEFENDREVELGTEYENDPEDDQGAEFKHQ